MTSRRKLPIPLAIAAVVAPLLVCGCKPTSIAATSHATESSKPSNGRDVSAILQADQAYTDAYKRGDWPSAAGLLAPGYYGVANDLEVDRAALERDFPKIHVGGYKFEQPRVHFVRPDLAVLIRVGSMNESFEGSDISGRYWFSGTWIRIDGHWKLLVEEEVALGGQPPAT
jgi:hypothetical protein